MGWVDLKNIDFAGDTGVRMLDLGPNQRNIFSGEVSEAFVAAQPFTFEPAE
jgi:choloylglycine hydrolase